MNGTKKATKALSRNSAQPWHRRSGSGDVCAGSRWLPRIPWCRSCSPSGGIVSLRGKRDIKAHNDPLIGAHAFPGRVREAKRGRPAWSAVQVPEEADWQVLCANQRLPAQPQLTVEVWRRFYFAGTCALKACECAQTPWISAICSIVEFWRISARQKKTPQHSSIFGHDASLRGGGITAFPTRGRRDWSLVLRCRVLLLSVDDVFVCRKALLHHRVSGGQGEPFKRRWAHPPDGSNLLQPDHGCVNEHVPGPPGQVALPEPGAGVPGVRGTPLPDCGSAPARRLPPTASALLRDAAPRPAQLLPLGPPEQVLWTPVPRWVQHAVHTDLKDHSVFYIISKLDITARVLD